MLRGLAGLTVPDGTGGVAPFVTPREALDALANGPAIDAGKIAAATDAWRAFYAALIGGDADAQLEVARG